MYVLLVWHIISYIGIYYPNVATRTKLYTSSCHNQIACCLSLTCSSKCMPSIVPLART